MTEPEPMTFPFVILGDDGKIDPRLYDSSGGGDPDDPEDPTIVRTNSSGVIDYEVLPPHVALTDFAGKLPASAIPIGALGLRNSVDFGYPGTFAVNSESDLGKQLWLSPPHATILPRALTATLGTLPSVNTAQPSVVTFRLNVNGAPYASVSVQEGNQSAVVTSFTGGPIPPLSLLSVDVMATPLSVQTRAADAVIQFWWEQI